ncbi:cytochrome d ubiquinol oxidase subunit II [Gordonia rubripertincta]|uniref:cytochrome d ubiquinol oxidase subunit II n=1 Tax=Gordonia rubripertincta TaxID=36822 RepID=UPI00117F8D4D|nr:cytochrome d ubiquinol oxidase subunit II [Gordonia rubripertincta]TSD97804.1 cytochrome d ubiquinol oxidase subunit II [Gordonia rubripertincta]
MISHPVPEEAIDLDETTGNLFGLGSPLLVRALVIFAVIYVAVTVGAGWQIRSAVTWLALTAGFALFVVAAALLMRDGRSTLPRGTAAVATLLTVAGLVTSFWTLPLETYLTLQTTPASSALTIILAMVVLYRRPLFAWVGAFCATGLAAVSGQMIGIGYAVGAGNTLFCYPVLVLATLFGLMAIPIPDRLRSLREQAFAQAAEEAATAASAVERTRQLERLAAGARPILEQIAGGHVFGPEEARDARLTEAQLRDTIRAPGWDAPEVGESVWAVRRRGISVRLLDDGALDEYASDDLADESSPGSLARRMLVGELTAVEATSADHGSVTARILPAGRDVLASIVVDVGLRMRRVEVQRDGSVSVDATPVGDVGTSGTATGPVAQA